MLNKEFKIVEIRKGGVTITHNNDIESVYDIVESHKGDVIITHYLKDKRSKVNKNIEAAKLMSSKYEMFGNEGMVIWVE